MAKQEVVDEGQVDLTLEYATPEDEELGGRMLEIIEHIDDFGSGHLELLIEHAEAALKKAHIREEEQAMAELEAVAKKYGFAMNDLVQKKAEELVSRNGSQAAAAQGSGEPVRFRHKKNPSLTWTGRGRLPRWLKEIKEDGGDIEEHRIAH